VSGTEGRVFEPPRDSHSAWEANLVKAPRRRRGEVGSKPTPGTSFRNQQSGVRDRSFIALRLRQLITDVCSSRDDSSIGRAPALQAGSAGSSPAHSTNHSGSAARGLAV
jgi:hypothetical protein